MYRNVPKNLFHNVWKCTEKAISKVIWEGKGALDAILSQINKKIGDRFHFQWRLNCQLSNYVIDKVKGSRVQPSLFGEDQRPDPGDGGNRAYHVPRAKKVVSDSPKLVGFVIGLVNSVINLTDGQVKFFEEFKLQKNCEINSAHQNVFGASWNAVWASIC